MLFILIVHMQKQNHTENILDKLVFKTKIIP